MNHNHFPARMAIGAVSILAAICSTTADAKGYGTHRSTSTQSEQQIDRRLSQMEEQQKAMQDAMALEFKKLRAELDSLKGQSAVKANLTTAK